jgi:hypothetical protein
VPWKSLKATILMRTGGVAGADAQPATSSAAGAAASSARTKRWAKVVMERSSGGIASAFSPLCCVEVTGRDICSPKPCSRHDKVLRNG